MRTTRTVVLDDNGLPPRFVVRHMPAPYREAWLERAAEPLPGRISAPPDEQPGRRPFIDAESGVGL